MIQVHEIQYTVTTCEVEDCGSDATQRLVVNETEGIGFNVCKPHLQEVEDVLFAYLTKPA